MSNGSPKPGFYIATAVAVIALVGYALFRFDVIGGGEGDGANSGAGTFTGDEMATLQTKVEDEDAAGITTVKQIRESSFDIKATGRLNRLYVELLKY